MGLTVVSSSIEEYLQALYGLTRNGRVATTTEISACLKVAPASATQMLKKLAERGYVKYSPYRGTVLTDKGLRIAERVTRKHRLLERFLHDVLEIRKTLVHKEACEMEHSLSDQAEVALCRFLKHPDRCPDDRKIIPPCGLAFSSCQECLEERADSVGVAVRGPNLVSICELRENDGGKVVFIRGDRKILQRLLDMGLTPGTSISVARVAPLKGPIELAVRGSKLALGQDIASSVFVEATKNNPSVK